MPITIKSEREIELMTEAGRILGIVHKELEKALKPGMSTLDIDALGEEVIRSYGCEPSFLNYNGYPANPDDKKALKEQEFLNTQISEGDQQ